MDQNYPGVQEGSLYEVLLVDGGTFEIHYGFYEDFERGSSEPIPIYPDLEKIPIYGSSGRRIVTHMQTPCPHFRSQKGDDIERCCGCCSFYPNNGQMINACQCGNNQISNVHERSTTI